MPITQISLREVKQALADPKFRAALPPQLKADIQKYEQNPGCPCNLGVYQNVLRLGRKQLEDYFPGHPIVDHDKQVIRLSENHWLTINCRTDELEAHLNKLAPGRKQIAVARYTDQITVIINELNLEVNTEDPEVMKLSENHWTVINCGAEDLESALKKLPPGRKQVAIARYEDQITVIINELNLAF